jgi:hypothetical protein
VLFSPLACALAAAGDIPTGNPQIQGGNLRIEFDDRLHSRVVARFDKKETVMGPFTASETVTTADKPWTGFLLTTQKHRHTKDAFGDGEQLTERDARFGVVGAKPMSSDILRFGIGR